MNNSLNNFCYLARFMHACADFCNTDLNFAEPFLSPLIPLDMRTQIKSHPLPQ